MSRPYKRVAKKRLSEWFAELSISSEPELFRSRVEEIHREIGREAFFVQGGIQFVRDAWIASRVATALLADTVRIWPGERPDFEVIINGEPRLFEATEADLPGRRRSDEYRQASNETEEDPVENWRKRFEAIPLAVSAVVSKKVMKEYAESVSLVSYVNLGCYDAYVSEGLPILRRETAPAKDNFQEVFALWEGTLYSFWKDGNSNFQKWRTARESDY